MRQVVTIVLAAALFVAALPLHVCGCDMASAAQPQAAKVCPYCGTTAPKSKEPGNKPCPCQDCGQEMAAVHVKAVTILSSECSVEFGARIAGIASCDQVVFPSYSSQDTQVDRSPGGSACSIPILLGQLLL